MFSNIRQCFQVIEDHSKTIKMHFWMIWRAKNEVFGHFHMFGQLDRLDWIIPRAKNEFFCIMLGFEAVLPSLPYFSLSLSCFLYRRSTKALLFFSWFDKNGFNSMCFYQCAFKVEKFMISGRNNSCSRMGLERKLCRLIPWDFRSPINSY